MMRRIGFLGLAGMLVSGVALADTVPVKHKPHVVSAGTPIDKGPYTAAANKAYQGGGVVLQGAPGAPPPTPTATPPGQTPKGMVPR